MSVESPHKVCKINIKNALGWVKVGNKHLGLAAIGT